PKLRGGSTALSDLRRVVRFAQDTITRSDPGLISAGAVKAFESATGPLCDSDRALSAAEVCDLTDALLDAVALLPGQSGRSFELELGRLTERHARALGQKIGSVDTRLRTVQARAEALATELAAAETRLRAAVGETDERLRTILTEVGDAIAAQQEQVEQVVADAKRASTEALEAHRHAVAQDRQEIRAEAEEARHEAAERAEAALAELETHRAESARLLSDVSVNATAGRYAKSAVEQRDRADRWRAAAVALGALAIVPAIVALVAVGDFEVRSLLPKVAISLILAGLARYAATQSSRHRTREERDEQVANDLSVFSAFIEALPEEAQSTERTEYARRLFRGRAMPGEESTATPPGVAVPDVVSAISALANLSDRAGGSPPGQRAA
ncbi:MAG: hypothetical protein M3320_10250, partial [Actinomycetota bacterium]|nr:hypothetical protein [Actinomycetota bacterium]